MMRNPELEKDLLLLIEGSPEPVVTFPYPETGQPSPAEKARDHHLALLCDDGLLAPCGNGYRVTSKGHKFVAKLPGPRVAWRPRTRTARDLAAAAGEHQAGPRGPRSGPRW